ncbi:hypothetical protein [Geodermatophilus sp. SYSU D00079]
MDALAQRVVDALRDLGIVPTTPPGARAGIVSFGIDEPAAVVDQLRRRGVHVVEKLGQVRVSPHFYNSEGDVDRFAEALRDALAAR